MAVNLRSVRKKDLIEFLESVPGNPVIMVRATDKDTVNYVASGLGFGCFEKIKIRPYELREQGFRTFYHSGDDWRNDKPADDDCVIIWAFNDNEVLPDESV